MAKNTTAKPPVASKTKARAGAKDTSAKGGGKIAPPKAGSAPNALQIPLKPSPELAAIVGGAPLPRGEVVSKVWTYIKEKNLQNPDNRREIIADGKLEKVFGKDRVTMFEMNKHLARHLS